MSVQMSLVFGILVSEMVILFLFVLPLPFAVRRKIVKVGDVAWSLQHFKVALVFITILLGLQFIDSLNRVNRFDFATNPYSQDYLPVMLSYEQLATKFFSQRNLYISGAVVYFELSIYTVFTVLKKLVLKEEKLRSFSSHAPVDEDEEKEKYTTLIEKKQLDIDTFKKQLEGLQSSYNSLQGDSEYEKKTE